MAALILTILASAIALFWAQVQRPRWFRSMEASAESDAQRRQIERFTRSTAIGWMYRVMSIAAAVVLIYSALRLATGDY